MKNELFKKWFVAALYVLALGSTAARAEPDSFGLGSGRNGAKTVSTPGETINIYAQVTGALMPGANTIPVGTCVGGPSCFVAGELVMVLQMTGLTPVPSSGQTGPFDISNAQVGRWEFARLASVSGSMLVLTAPLISSYAAHVTQVIRVPEYTSVTITGSGSIKARPWDGSVGGVITFLATGGVSNAGAIDASGTGFRGGPYAADEINDSHCSSLDELSPSGAMKGEGIVNGAFSTAWSGRGNVANGAGGGICYRSGGGGGGNGGAGGEGGLSDDDDGSRSVGGLGGAALVYSMLDHLTLGGGGGAGHGSGRTGGSGTGGGIVFIRAHQLTGTGLIDASGRSGSTSVWDGGGGGGAGGSIYLRFVSTAACGAVSSYGGSGGSVNEFLVGPGGGGGGGRVLFQAAGGSCSVDADAVSGANPGIQRSTSAGSYGAMPGSDGIFYHLAVPPVPTVTSPVDGSLTSNNRSTITGMTSPSTTVLIFIEGVQVGQTFSDVAGNYSYTRSTDLSDGIHVVQAATKVDAMQSPKSPANTFTVDSTAPAVPTIQSPANGAVLSNSIAAISGTAEANSILTVVVRGQPYSVMASSTGTWSVPASPPLTDGNYAVTATARDAAGNFSPTATSTFTVGSIAPAAPAIVTPANGEVLSNSITAISGTAEPGSKVTVVVQGTTYPEFTVPTSGEWSVTLNSPLTNGGPYSATVTARDAAGNTSTATSTFTVDSTAPAAPVITTPANGALLSNSLPFIAGVTEPYSTITLLIDGVVHGTVPSNMMGHWSYTPQTNLADGPHAVGAVAVDNAGNVSPAATSTFSLDTLAPDTTIVVRPPSVSNSTSATFEFHSAEAGVMFLCRLDGGAFAFCSNPMTFTSLSATVHSLEVRAMDMAGNEDATPDSYSWRVDPGAGIDADADGLPDSIEMASSTNPADDDSDDDGILDGNEDTNRNGVVDPGEANPRAVDTDGDGLQDGLEMGLTSPQGQNTNIAIFMLDADPTTRTSPFQADTDGDGIPDGIEDSNHNGRHDPGELDPLDSTDGTDTDGDGLDNDTESRLGLDPFDGDCDDDGVLDGVEGLIDSDGDGRIDALDPDSDDDGVFDGTERGVTLATAPVWTDTRSPHFHLDADPATTTDPRRADTDGDGLLDGDEDHDANGFFDARSEMDPNDPDTDHDGVSDGVEAQQGTGTDGQTPQRGGCSATGSSLGGTLAVLLLGPSLRRRRHPRNR